ncbi:MAG: methyltransferase domain-containing protein [Actinomycetota bacterium]|nr:methyltransferase domain-containing protein [Actinomycetota bacterium]
MSEEGRPGPAGPTGPTGPTAEGAAAPHAARWAAELAAWAIPEEILRQAPAPPHRFPPELFRADRRPKGPRPALDRAREALDPGDSVLDVGCGGGGASLALVPPATRLIGVDAQPSMVDAFTEAAAHAGVGARAHLGTWPDIAPEVGPATVAVAFGLAYNVADLATSVVALDAHAGRRCVLELTDRHPAVDLAPLWRHFWDLDRPAGPTAGLAREVVREAGLDARLEVPAPTPHAPADPSVVVAFTRTRLCLPPSADAELARLLAAEPPRPVRRCALWWPTTDT